MSSLVIILLSLPILYYYNNDYNGLVDTLGIKPGTYDFGNYSFNIYSPGAYNLLV